MKNWTQEQLKAIETEPNLLVSAAAGSGKTAVLVERITRKLIPDDKGKYIPVDKLLVVTFARDAAKEMQDRIQVSLNEAYVSEKDRSKKRVLKEQLKKLVFADISTIDSFCMRFVKQNFHLLGIDPRFKIIDQAEANTFKSECMDEYFDTLYESKDKNFFLLTSLYSKNYDDREVSELITSVYDFTRALPDPDHWLSVHADDYASFSQSIFCVMVEENFNSSAKEACLALKRLAADYKKSVGTEDETLLAEYGSVDLWSALKSNIAILDLDSFLWDDIYKLKNKFVSVTKPRAKSSEATLQKEYVDYMRAILEPVISLANWVKDSADALDKIYRENLYPHACAIAELTSGFAKFFVEKKNKSGRYEFNDLEHMTLELLRSNEDIRNGLKTKYEEILMDEYQDTNALQEEIFTLISNGANRFMVGDMKQSIYRFRNSDPLIFRHKDELYGSNPAEGHRVVLSKNFRSRSQVLQSVNVLFERIMSYKVGEVVYNQDQALHYGNTDFDNEAPDNSYTSELYVIEGTKRETDDEDLLSDEETEAAFVADKIRTMIDSRFQVFEGGKFRDVCERDFAILMNAVKANSGVYINALKERGLNGYSEDKDFFEKTEIRLITSFVRAVNNPLRDIPLVSVMRSPIYRFTDEELSLIRLSARGEFWRGVKSKAKEDDTLSKKCAKFCEDINRWRSMSSYMSADRLIWRIMTDCSLYDMCGILYGGEAALSNLKLYMERARSLSDGGVATLHDFEVYIDRIIGSDGIGSANSTYDGIPIMTIHKSKGLEFPVVFVCGTGKRLMFDGLAGFVNLHKELGFGLNNINSSGSFMTSTVNRNLIGAVKNSENISEQLRKLYVALTRAKEKLIVTGVVGASKNRPPFEFADQPVTEKYIENAKSFIKIMAPAIKQFGGNHWLYHEIEAGTLDFEEMPQIVKKDINDTDSENNRVGEVFDKFMKIKNPPSVTSKISVTELKGKSGIASALLKYPAFMSSGMGSGAAFGTAVHKVMEHIELKSHMTKEYILDEVYRILELPNETVAEKVYGFFTSSLGKRILSASQLCREADFEIEIPATDSKGVAVEGETMLLQGVVDLYFQDSDSLVLVDYKTDKCSDISELAEKYSVQLKWYKFAMEKLLNKKVDEVYVYSFHKNSYTELSEMID